MDGNVVDQEPVYTQHGSWATWDGSLAYLFLQQQIRTSGFRLRRLKQWQRLPSKNRRCTQPIGDGKWQLTHICKSMAARADRRALGTWLAEKPARKELAMVIPIQAKERRGYFMLPQAPEQAGYYVYGNLHGVAGTGHLAQFAHPNMLTYIFQIEREWQAMCDRKFGIGNISIDGGEAYDKHKTHRKGIEMDCRPVRKDFVTGQGARCTYRDKTYDQEATIRLIRLFLTHPWTKIVYFNDGGVQKALGARVTSVPGHNDHFHVELWPRYAS
jgi:hypothetical protein